MLNRFLPVLSEANNTGTAAPTGRLAGFLGLVFLLSAAVPLVAVASPASPQQSESHGEEAGEDVERRNEVALLLGGTYEHEEHRFTTGFEYARRVHQYVGVGGVVEYLDGGTWIYIFPVFIHPVGGLKLLAGPGFEREHGENKFLFRVGVGYGIEFAERFSVQPAVEVDFVGREEVLVYGVTLGVSF